MTPSARVQAAIDLLDAIIASAREQGASADKIVADYFRSRRYIGSKDRRAVRDHVYRAIRAFGECPVSGRAAMLGLAVHDADLAAQFDGSHYGPAPIARGEPVAAGGAIAPWMQAHFPERLDADEQAALLDRATLDLRWHAQRSDALAVRNVFPDAEFPVGAQAQVLPWAFRLPIGTRVEDSALYRAGAIEVQDWGSQAIAALCRADDARLAVDLCAGAGGKALALAAVMPENERLIACDISRSRLQAMAPRRDRADAQIIETLLLDPGRERERLAVFDDRADLVLVDAPCSGSGTWRRNPETRWRLTPARLDRLIGEQARLLDLAHRLVRPGGALVYAVCSLFEDEGAGQIAAFLSRHPGYSIHVDTMPIGRPHPASAALGIMLTPLTDRTDGFFFTRLQKPC